MKPYPLQPILNRVVIRPDPEIKKVGLIHIPDIAKKDSEGYLTGEFVVETGTIMAAGPKVRDVTPGMRVQFRRVGDGAAGVPLNVNGEDVLIMREDDLIAVYA